MDERVVRNYLILGEGWKPKVYKDSLSIKTVGVGHNLTREDSPQRLFDIGAVYKDIEDGTRDLTNEQIFALLDQDMLTAVRIAEHLFPRFHSFDDTRQTILVDLAFNIAPDRLRGFHRMIEAINSNASDKWSTAAHELEHSHWYHQVGQRGPRNVKALRTGIMPPFHGG